MSEAVQTSLFLSYSSFRRRSRRQVSETSLRFARKRLRLPQFAKLEGPHGPVFDACLLQEASEQAALVFRDFRGKRFRLSGGVVTETENSLGNCRPVFHQIVDGRWRLIVDRQATDVSLEILDLRSSEAVCRLKLSRQIDGKADRTDGFVQLHRDKVFALSSTSQLLEVALPSGLGEKPAVGTVVSEPIAAFAVVCDALYVLSKDGLISNLEQKSINVKLPCQEDEKFTHMKYGCGMLIAISFRTKNKRSINHFHLVHIKPGKLQSVSNQQLDCKGSGTLG